MELALRYGGRLMGVFKYGVQGFGVEIPESGAIALSNDPLVSFVEENGLFHLSYDYLQEFSEDEVLSDEYWHLDRIDNQYGFLEEYRGFYAYTSTGSDVNVYVIDTGIRAKHQEFDLDGVEGGATRVTAGADFNYEGTYPEGHILEGRTPTPDNPCGGDESSAYGAHGTAVASVIGGSFQESGEEAGNGVAKSVTLVPVKVGTCLKEPIPGISIMYALDWVIWDMQQAWN